MKYVGLRINNVIYKKYEIASTDVDAENCFTPYCMGELPVKEGHLIVNDLNEQAKRAAYRIGSKDAHSMASLWVDTDKNPQFSEIAGYENLDIRWNVHGVPGTFGFKLIEGLPKVTEYNYFVWKGIELDMHPYGMCYHDLHQKMSTGVLEWLHSKGVYVCIVGGLATDYCVKVTVEQLLKSGFIVILNLSACRSISKEGEVSAIESMIKLGGNKFIIINKTEELDNLSVYEED
jgi:nicotinamidase/pyrazinamidase